MTITTDRKETEIGMIPQEWEVLKLDEISDIKSGKSRPKEIGEYPVYGGNGILDYANEYNIDTNSIIIGRVGAYCGCVYLEKNKFWLSDNALGLINNEKSDIQFLYYMLKNLNLNTKSIGGAQPLITQGILKEIDIALPPLPEQQVIATTLGSLDDKIELLREQNKTLEAMGKAMFKSLFVDFEGQEFMVESEMGMIPKGWKVYKLEEIVESINGYSYKGSELVESSEEALVTLKSFDRNGGFQTRGFKPFIGKPKPTQEVFTGDLVVAHTDLTQNAEVLGNPAFIFDNGGYKKLYITMDLVKIVSKNDMVENSFLYYLMKTEMFKGHCVGYSSGTTVLHLSKKAIPEFEIALPIELDLVKKFSKSASEITNKITNNMSEIESLVQTRDNLLPRLMSGKVRVI